jgi:hypothetical protein
MEKTNPDKKFWQVAKIPPKREMATNLGAHHPPNGHKVVGYKLVTSTNWLLYTQIYLRFWSSNVPMISDLNICIRGNSRTQHPGGQEFFFRSTDTRKADL